MQAETGEKLTEPSALENLKRSLASTHRNELNAVKRPRLGSSTGKAKSHLYNLLGKPKARSTNVQVYASPDFEITVTPVQKLLAHE